MCRAEIGVAVCCRAFCWTLTFSFDGFSNRGDFPELSFERLNLVIGRSERLAFSAASLLEIAVLTGGDRLALKGSLGKFFGDLSADAAFCMLPLTYDVAIEAASLGVLRDPADRAIAATARVHRLKLVTSDQRIIESGLVPVVE
jgi:PIN domain nuclease of toxin-antitoxin system